MICGNCRLAADAYVLFKQEDMAEDREGLDYGYARAVNTVYLEGHSHCKGSNHCDCQHGRSKNGQAGVQQSSERSGEVRGSSGI